MGSVLMVWEGKGDVTMQAADEARAWTWGNQKSEMRLIGAGLGACNATYAGTG